MSGRLGVALVGRLGVAMVLCGALACARPAPVEIPERRATCGDALLFAVPKGADLLLEIDLERLRKNRLVGPLAARIRAPAPLAEIGARTAPGYDVLARADALLVAVYDIGEGSRQLVFVEAESAPPGAERISEGVFAWGGHDLLARSAATAAGREPSASSDGELLRARAQAMPDAARSASLRLAALLDFDARVSVANQVGLSEVPTAASAWVDVVDDLAIVLELDVETAADSDRLARGIREFLRRLAQVPAARAMALSSPLRSARIQRSPTALRVVLLVSPKRLQLVIARILRQMGAASS